jgi:CheY-like chemotaxis protein
MMGGKIELQSIYGRGSVFTATIRQSLISTNPIGKEMADNLQHFRFIGKHSKEINRIMIQDGKVLVVDDVQMNIDVARGFLAPYGLAIDEAKSGERAIELVRNSEASPYDIIFMDHMMPGMDGIEATRKIRALGEYPRKVPIIALTANALAGNREMFLENGLDDFLAKPINVQKLNTILEKWVPLSKRMEKQIVEPKSDLNGTDIPAITGINTALGITNTGGSLSVYRNILSVFCIDVAERIPMVRETLASGDIVYYTTLVHALKSACRNIGAQDAGGAAAYLEKAGKENNLPLLHTATEPLLAKLEQLIAHITEALEKGLTVAGDAANKDAGGIDRPVLESLKEALLSMDIQTVSNILRECGSRYTDKKNWNFLLEIEQCVLLFEYEKAAELVDRELKGR